MNITIKSIGNQLLRKITLCLLFVLLTASLAHAKRVALVMGNDNYISVSKLQKAGNDADAMARELRAAGFVVQLQKNLNYRSMIKAVDSFVESITGGDEVVVFFAGHGVQIRSGSYLLPTDIEADNESQVEKTAYGLNDLTEKLSEAKAAFSLVVVDACRDNPLRTKGRSIGATRGLSPVEPAKGQMVIYSASKGQQALDRLNERDANPNGIFTREFISRMRKPGVKIEEMVREVQDAVENLAKSVRHEQRPALYNEARGNFYFYGPTIVQAAPKPYAVPVISDEQKEKEFWDDTKSAGNKEAFEAYLESYPTGRYASLAKANISRLSPVPASPTKPTVAFPTNPETLQLYKLANEQNDANAQVRLGVMYANGTGGLVKDDAEAVRLYKLAAEKNYSMGQFYLALMYEHGRGGLPKDDTEAVRLLKLAVAQNDALAQSALGFMMMNARGGLARNAVEAVRLFNLSASQGSERGLNNLGGAYLAGIGGLARNEVEAVRLFKLAAAMGYALAQRNLGLMYENGIGGLAKDDYEAVRLYKLASVQNNDQAQYNLALMHEHGRGGLAKDDYEAVRLYKLAAAQSNNAAQNSLIRMEAAKRGGL